MSYQAVNFKDKLGLFSGQWSPKVIAEMNDYQFKVVKIQDEFVWHDHKDTHETFIVLEGSLRIDFRDGHVNLAEGEMYVIPRGTRAQAIRRARSKSIADRAYGSREYRR